MELANRIQVGALNVAASPHEDGVYFRLMESVADIEVSIGGSDHAKLTKMESTQNYSNVYMGRICVWASIEKDGPWFNKITNDEASSEDKKAVEIPDYIAPNYRYFYYAIDVKRHIVLFETKNEFNQSLSQRKVRRLFDTLFDTLPNDAPDVAVTVIPEEGTVERILALPRLRHLKIVVTRPNPDDLTDQYAQIMKRLNDQNAKSITEELRKAARVDSLKPDNNTRALAMVAETNGFVEGDALGIHESTKAHPKRRWIEVGKDGSSIAKFLSGLLLF
jgi:Domain of unknown function (DUF4747)